MNYKKGNVLYIFNFCSDDIGPMNHAREVIKNTEYNISYISNIRLHGVERQCLSLCPEVKLLGTFFNIQFFQFFCLLKILLSNDDFDAFIVRQSMGFGILNLMLRLFRKKVMTEVNGLLIQDAIDRNRSGFEIKFVKKLERLTLSCSDVILTVHDNIKENLSEFYGSSIIDKCVVVENGVYIEEPSLPAKPTQKVKIGYLGSFAHREGVDFLPSISKRLQDMNLVHELYMVGGSSSDVDQFMSIAKKQGVQDNFHMFGYVELNEAKEILKQCHIFIHLRRPIKRKVNSQGCPLKMLDYLSIGRCVIATKIESYLFLEEKSLGYLVKFVSTFEDDVAKLIAEVAGEGELENYYNKGQTYLTSKTWYCQVQKVDMILDDLVR